jgi:multiple sugar transport system substrate-binding protein
MSSEQNLAGRRATSRKNCLSRRDFLKLGGVGLAGVAVLGASGCGGGGESSGRIVFTSPDLPGSISRLVDKFNEQNKSKFQAAYRAIALESQEYFDRLKTEFQAGGGEMDVILGNEAWPAEFAENGWITDVTDTFANSEQSSLKYP